jgi:peptide/nickel transport system substrate-binding protein
MSAALLAVTGCGSSDAGPDGASGAPAAAGAKYVKTEVAGKAAGPVDSFSWSVYKEPSSLDPLFAATYPPATVISNVCESLMRLNPDYSITPALAETVEKPDARTYVYKLRSGVKFHDGATMTADDVVYSLKRNMNPDLGSFWGVAYRNVKSIAATGPAAVTVKLAKPDALFNQFMSTPAGAIDSKAFVEKAGKAYGAPDAGVDCTGPFSFESWQKGSAIVLKAFDGYWDAQLKPHAKQVSFAFLTDPAARATALKTGRVDGAFYITPAGSESLRDTGAGKLFYGVNPTVRSLPVFHLSGPMKDARIRLALSLAIDRQKLIDGAFGGIGSPARAPVSRDAYAYGSGVFSAGYDALPAVDPPNIETAKKLVQEAGAPKEPIVIASSNADPSYGLTALVVQAAGQAIGLDVKIETLPIQVYDGLFGDAKRRAEVDLYQATWYLDFADPLEFYGLYSIPGGAYNNFNDYADPKYTALADRAMAATDEGERAKLTSELEAMFVKNALWIPLYEIPTTAFLNKRLGGLPVSTAYLSYPWAAEVGAAG